MTVAALRALHAVIGAAIDEIDREYQSQSKQTGLPLDYPSLDVPYYISKENPPEVEKSEALRTEPIIFGAANKIVAACGQLTATVHKPFFSLVEGVQGVSAFDVLLCPAPCPDVMQNLGQLHSMHAVLGGNTRSRDPP